jgi:hypothetical protein
MDSSAAVHAAIVAQAIKASGSIVRVSPADFFLLLSKAQAPLVVVAEGGVFKKHVKYLMSYRGLTFYAESPSALVLPRGCEVVAAKKIWLPQ